MALRQYDFFFKAMACKNKLSLYAKNKNTAKVVADNAIKLINKLEQRYSRYRPNSLLSKINATAGNPNGITVDSETAALLDYAQTCYQQSDGLFDITSGVLRKIWDFKNNRLPQQSKINTTLQLVGWNKLHWQSPHLTLPIAGMQLDFGGIVKEYAADSCANLCRQQGIEHGMINMGGDIHVIGAHPDGSAWQIGIQDPSHPERIITTVNLKYGGLASSGDYQRFVIIDGQRYSHILNPKTGWPVRGLRAVSVIAPHCLIAGSTSTIAMLKAEDGKSWLNETGLPYLWVDDENELFIHTANQDNEQLN